MTKAQEAPAPNLVPVRVDDLASAEPPRTRYVVEGLIPQALGLLGGHGGAGKTILALTIAAHVAAGVPFAGRKVNRGRVVLVSLEDEGSVVRFRLKRIVSAFGLDPRALAEYLVILDGTAGSPGLAAEVGDFGGRTMLPTATYEEAREACAGAVLIIVDNASDAFDGNENDRRQVRAFLRLLAQLGRDIGAAVLLLAHLDKAAARYGSAGNSYSGSTAWHNSPRFRFALLKDGQVIELRQEKNNLGPLAAPLYFRWGEGGVLVPADPLEAFDCPDADIGADNTAVMAAVVSALDIGTPIPPARTGPSTAFHVLKTLPEFPSWAHKGREGKDRFWAAMTRLERLGWIERQDYRTEDRKSRVRYALGKGAPAEAKRPRQWARKPGSEQP